MLQGSLVAIASPMHRDGSLDINSLRKLIDFHVEQGTDGIVIVGTTGESPTVDFEEHCLLIRTAVETQQDAFPSLQVQVPTPLGKPLRSPKKQSLWG